MSKKTKRKRVRFTKGITLEGRPGAPWMLGGDEVPRSLAAQILGESVVALVERAPVGLHRVECVVTGVTKDSVTVDDPAKFPPGSFVKIKP